MPLFSNVSFQYEEREVNVQCQRRLEENRRVWENDVKTFLEPLPRSLLVGAVYVESVISKLMKTLQYANPAQKADLENAGVGLFYLLADLINGDVKRNSPAIQFFSSSTEVLGEVCISLLGIKAEPITCAIFNAQLYIWMLAFQ